MKNSLLLALWLFISVAANSQYVYEDVIDGERFGHLQLRTPWGIAVGPQGNIYVNDVYNNRTAIFNVDGSNNRTIDLSEFGVMYPLGIDVDQNGYVYITEANGKVLILDQHDNLVRSFGSLGSGDGQFSYPMGIAVGPDGRIYVDDAYNSRTQVFDNLGNFLYKFSFVDDNGATNSISYSISLDPNGNIYLPDYYNNRILLYSNAGNYLGLIPVPVSPTSPFSQIVGVIVDQFFDVYILELSGRVLKVITPGNNPYHLVGGTPLVLRDPNTDPDPEWSMGQPVAFALNNGMLYFSEYRADRVSYLTASGQPGILVDDKGDGQVNFPDDIAIAPDGNVYVLDNMNNRIQVFDRHGEFLFKFGSVGVGNGKVLYPHCIAIDNNGDVYVQDQSSAISRFDKDGNFLDHAFISVASPNQEGGIAVDDNFIYLSYMGGIVNVFDKSWNFQRTIGSSSPGLDRVSEVEDIATDDDGNIYMACETNKVKAFSSDGTFLREFSKNDNHYVISIAVDEHGKVFVSDRYHVHVFDAAGNEVQEVPVGNFGAAGVAVANNRLYVSETEMQRVFIYSDLPEAPIYFQNQSTNYSNDSYQLLINSDNQAPISFKVDEGDQESIINGDVISLHSAGQYTIHATRAPTVTHRKTHKGATLTVAKAMLTVKADDKVRTYGDNNPQFTQQITGFRSGDDISQLTQLPVSMTMATPNSSVGTYDITPVDGSALNYEFDYEPGQLTINKAPLFFSTDNIVRTYGDENPEFTIYYSGMMNYDFFSDLDNPPTIITDATIASPIGEYVMGWSHGSDNNYEFNYTSSLLTIVKAPLTITAENKSRTYGEQNPELTLKFIGFKNNDTFLDLDTSPTIISSVTPEYPPGEYLIMVNDASDFNYEISYEWGTFTINKAQLTVKAENKSKVYKTDNPDLTIEYSGFKNGDDEVSFITSPNINTIANKNSSVGEYPIEVTGGISTNYEFSYLNGKLTVTKANQEITFENLASPVFNTLPPFALNATSTSDLSVNYTVESGPASVSTNLLSLSGDLGSVTVKASQPGSINYFEATPVLRTFEVILDPVLGIDEDSENVKIYPNPANGEFYIESPSLQLMEVFLLDAKGMKIHLDMEERDQQFLVNLSDVPAGLYFLRMKTNHGQYLTRKISVVR